MNPTLGKIHFWITFLGLNGVFIGQLLAGYAGQPRWFFDPYQYEYLAHLRTLNRVVSYFAFVLIGGQAFFVVNFFMSVFAGKKAEKNPWEVGTLEWELSSPPPVHNFDVIPTVVRGPHEFNNPEYVKKLGRDWISQTEPLPGEEPSAHEEAEEGGAAAASA